MAKYERGEMVHQMLWRDLQKRKNERWSKHFSLVQAKCYVYSTILAEKIRALQVEKKNNSFEVILLHTVMTIPSLLILVYLIS